ncbi:hypothetical protein BA6E_101302 [Bacteroidales bacterium 6E]|nr:hypothetical protein BA6E_101302 [Bacteroidales bacterium 6E]
MLIFYVRYFLGTFGTITPLILGLLNLKYLRDGWQWIFGFVVLGFIISMLNVHVFVGVNNLFLVHLYVPLKFILFTGAYRHFLKGFVSTRILVWVVVLFIGYNIFNTMFIQRITEYNSYPRALGSFLISIYAILWYLKTLTNMEIRRMRDEPVVWFNTGVLIYFAGSFFVFILSNQVLFQSVQLSKQVWLISSTLMFIFYQIIAYSFFLVGKNAKSKAAGSHEATSNLIQR